MGAEAGQGLATIIRRKEMERQLGSGQFLWGIGQSLGKNADIASRYVAPLHTLFSPMLSAPKAIDANPTGVVMWTSWVDSLGNLRPLPAHSLITSRATLPSGNKKMAHYALVCSSDNELQGKTELCIYPEQLQNMFTNKPLGASQVTAVVRVSNILSEKCKARGYPVSFTATLQFPYFVRLAHPVQLDPHELAEIDTVSKLGDIESFSQLIRRLRQLTADSFATDLPQRSGSDFCDVLTLTEELDLFSGSTPTRAIAA